MRSLSKHQRRGVLRASVGIGAVIFVALAAHYIDSRHFAVLDPQGPVGRQQKQLLIFASLLSLVVIVPVYGLTFYIVQRYRSDARKPGSYQPEWDGNRRLEALWWGVPAAIILLLSVVTWNTSHSLDPFKLLKSPESPLQIQVVAMQWKWLFLYPDQGIASVNYVQFPDDRPVTFTVTADAPMNSFWIPQLGGQIYAMAGMKTKLNLQADSVGNYAGSSANISGDGFADMRFTAQSTSPETFALWAKAVKEQSPSLDGNLYRSLAQPSRVKTPELYSLKDDQLFDMVIAKYNSHNHGSTSVGEGN